MYSYEDRLRALQRYVKLGKRIGRTIRQLGHLTKNALETWYRECEQSHELRTGDTRQSKFSPAEKERAAEHYLDHGQRIAATIKALGYPCPASSERASAEHQLERHRQDNLPRSTYSKSCSRELALVRQYLPKGADLSVYSQADLDAISMRLNTRPRETLDYEMPANRLRLAVAATG